MTVKTLLIVIATLAIVASILSITWDISAWMQGIEVKPVSAPTKVEPAPATKADTSKIPVSTPTKPDQDVQTGSKAGRESGAYDDSWKGTEEEKAEAARQPEPKEAETVTQPAPDTQQSDVVPFSDDDRENVEPEPERKLTGPDGKVLDPYKPDVRETN